MPEIFLEFIGNASPWLIPLLVVLAVWGKFNWDALNNPEKKASFERAVGWLREDSFGQLYLRFLGGLMDRVGSWIGDRHRLSQDSMVGSQPKGLVQRVFGFNPFTSESYEKCLWLAFIYPVLAYLIAWAMGAEGEVGNTSLFDVKSNEMMLWQRWSTLGGMLLFIGLGLWFVLHWRTWKRWLALAGVLLLAASITGWLGSVINGVVLFGVFSILFLFIFLFWWLANRAGVAPFKYNGPSEDIRSGLRYRWRSCSRWRSRWCSRWCSRWRSRSRWFWYYRSRSRWRSRFRRRSRFRWYFNNSFTNHGAAK